MRGLKFSIGSLDSNHHGWWKDADGKYQSEPIKGPKFSLVALSMTKPSRGYRLIWYWPSTAWWHVDVYLGVSPKRQNGG